MSPTTGPVAAGGAGPDHGATLIVGTDDAGTIEYADEAAARLFGRSVDELTGMPLEQLMPERFRSDDRHRRHALLTEPADRQLRATRVVHALVGGEEKMVVVDFGPVDGHTDRMRVSVQPLERWVDAAAWTMSAFEHSPTPIALVELTPEGDRIIRAANAALGRLLGYEVAELLGVGFDRLSFADDEATDRAAAAAMVEGPSRLHARRKRYRHRDGHAVWCDLASRLLPGDGGPALALAQLTDVSAEVALESMRRDTEASLRAEVEARSTELAASERLLRQSLVAASMASWIYDVTDDRFALVADDDSWPDLRTGRHSADVFALLHPDDVDELRRAVRDAADSATSLDVTLRTRPDLRRRWVRVAGDAVTDRDGATVLVTGIVQDVTAAQELIDDLRRSERTLSLSIEAAGIGTWGADLESGEQYCDATTRTILGLDDDEAFDFGASVRKVHRDDVGLLVASTRQLAADGTPFAMTVRLDDHRGARWIRCWNEAVLADDGTPEAMIGVLQDVTAERRLVEAARAGEQMLREREERLRLVLAATTTGTWDWNIPQKTIEFSPQYLQHLGHERTLSGDAPWAWDVLVHPDDMAKLEEHLGAHFRQRTAFCECVHRLRAADGSWRWFRTRGRVVERDESGRPLRMIGAAVDISEHKQMEAQLLQGAKMQALGAFAGSVAHDFNNVMAIVRGQVEFLRNPPAGKPADPDETERRLAAIEQSVDRASSFVRQLMVLGRPSEDRPADVDVGAFILDLAPTLAQFLGETIALEVDIRDDPLQVRIDTGRLEALVLNLAANARDAMPAGGALTITVRAAVAPDVHRRVVMEFTDTGIGMDSATAASAFDPFFTTKAPGVGAGLGLASAMATVTSADGTIEISSTVGSGTTLAVTLPMAKPAAEAAPVPSAAHPPTRTGTVLLVEDEAELLELTADALRSHGHRVHAALSGAEAIEILESDIIDLVVTDAVMPGMSGPELAATVAERWPEVPILFLTGYAGEGALPSISANDVLTKPVPLRDLLAAVEAKLAG